MRTTATTLCAAFLTCSAFTTTARHNARIESMRILATENPCKKVSFVASLQGGQSYAHDLGSDLELRLSPIDTSESGDTSGWIIKVTQKGKENQDYAYPLNPPLRFANSQWLATGYGIPVREQLSLEHRVRFILNATEYKRIHNLVMCALGPCQTSNPSLTAKEYLDTIAHAPAGLVHLVVGKFDTTGDGKSVNWMHFSVTVVVPSDFQLAPNLNATGTDCPAEVRAPSPEISDPVH